MRIAILHSRVRTEERMLLDAFTSRGVRAEAIDVREVYFDVEDPGRWREFDVVLDRGVSLKASITAVRVLEHFGVRCVNSGDAIEACSDKLRTTMALHRAGLPVPRTCVATSLGAGLAAIEHVGYPAVVKPAIGSWGRLVSRVNDRDAAEAILEHRETLGSVQQHVHYVQEHVRKPGRDLRLFVVGGRTVAAISRSSEHWVTNTARGAVAAGLEVTPELAELGERAARCVGADLCAIDVLECPRRGYLVNEVNHSMEFRNSVATSGVDIPGIMVEHVVALAREGVPDGGVVA